MRFTLVVTALLGTVVAAQPSYTPARLAAGMAPALAPMAVGGGQAMVELDVDASGRVTNVTTLRSTPPYTQALINAVAGWRFTPATRGMRPEDRPRAVDARVLVVALYRPPSLLTPTQGQRPVDVAAASPDVAYPSTIREPPYPPNALFGGVVVIEARVDATGAVTNARVVISSPSFDSAALQAARGWSFSPPRRRNGAESYVYLVFGFPQPVTGN